jgi:hypothetical protein
MGRKANSKWVYSLTETILTQIHSNAYRVVYAELTKPWREYAEDITEGFTVRTQSIESSFDISVLEQVQLMGVRIAGQRIATVLPQKRGTGIVAKWQQDVKWAMRAHNLKYVDGIDEWQRKTMVKHLQEAVDKHQTPKEIAKSFLSAGLQISAVRAERIAVTEGTRAAAMGVMLAANDFPYECEKRWVSSGDNRVRRSPYSHNIDVNDARELGQPWFNGELIMFPGDPRCKPGNVVNCRCTLALVAKRDVDGNLIPKRVLQSNRSLLTGVVIGLAAAAIYELLDEIFGDG